MSQWSRQEIMATRMAWRVHDMRVKEREAVKAVGVAWLMAFAIIAIMVWVTL